MFPILHHPKAARYSLQFSGSELFAPHANALETTPWRIVISAEGVKLIGTAEHLSIYGTFGAAIADSTVECTLSQLDSDVGPTSHSGIVLRYQDINNFAVAAMINIDTGHFEVVDKLTSEHIYYDHAVDTGLSYNTRYKIRIELAGSTAVCSLYDDLGTLLDTYTHSILEGTPATGYTAAHIYGATAVFHSLRSWDGAAADLVNSNRVFASVYSLEHRSGLFISSGQLDFYSDGTNGSVAGWMNILTNISLLNFYMTGTFVYKSGRVCGISFRSNAEGAGYHFFYDSTVAGVAKFYKDKLATSVQTWTGQGLLSADTEYPWSLKVSGTTYTFVINGHTYTVTDASYPLKGYIGFVGFQGHYLLKNMVVVGG